jgi:NAD(P)H-hydrate repair Nnr-like enzyme with NAD(P)H-hydrate dehydratase domain
LTPHAGEAERLGVPPELLASDRYAAARWLAAKYDAVVVLKGPGTVVAAPGSQTAFVDTAGTADLATAGSGDVLAGLIGSVLAIGVQSLELAAEMTFAAVFVHGMAGRVAAAGDRPVRAPDIVAALPTAIAALRQR